MDICHLCVMLHCPSFLWGLLYMCVLPCSEGKRAMSISVLMAVESVHLAHSHWHPISQRYWQNWAVVLVTTGCLAVLLRLWHPWYTFRTSLNWTDVTWHSCFITQCQTSIQIFHWASANLTSCLVHSLRYTHTNCEMLTEKNNKLSLQHFGCKPSLKFEKSKGW